MKEKFIQVDDHKLFYLEANEDADQKIFFIHGNSCSARMWSFQLNDNRFNNYRLIAFDLPGHGKTSHSTQPNEGYSPIGSAQILSKAINLIAGGTPFILVGFSYGTNLVAEIVPHVFNVKGIILLSSCVFGEDYGMDKIFLQLHKPSIYTYNEKNEDVVKQFINDHLQQAQESEKNLLVEDYVGVSTDFKPTLFKTASEGKISDEIKILQSLPFPVAVIFGKKDKLLNIHYLDDQPFLIWKNKIYQLDGGHWINMDNRDAVNDIIAEYADDAFTPKHALPHN